MNLITFEYIANQGLSNEWRVEKCEFGRFNLILGKNASGKSRLLNAIWNLAEALKGGGVLEPLNNEWHLLFNTDKPNCQLEYLLKVEKGLVIKEQLFVHKHKNKFTLIERGESGGGVIWAEELGRQINFKSPMTRTAIAQRQDSIQHPFLKLFYNWAWAVLLNYYEAGTGLDNSLICNSLGDTHKTVIVDNFGCGLDYESAPIAAKALVEKSSRSPAQLILTTHDQFVVNSIPLHYLSVVERCSSGIRLHNIFNSLDKFEEFKFLGLNNFDLFTGEFLLSDDRP